MRESYIESINTAVAGLLITYSVDSVLRLLVEGIKAKSLKEYTQAIDDIPQLKIPGIEIKTEEDLDELRSDFLETYLALCFIDETGNPIQKDGRNIRAYFQDDNNLISLYKHETLTNFLKDTGNLGTHGLTAEDIKKAALKGETDPIPNAMGENLFEQLQKQRKDIQTEIVRQRKEAEKKAQEAEAKAQAEKAAQEAAAKAQAEKKAQEEALITSILDLYSGQKLTIEKVNAFLEANDTANLDDLKASVENMFGNASNFGSLANKELLTGAADSAIFLRLKEKLQIKSQELKKTEREKQIHTVLGYAHSGLLDITKVHALLTASTPNSGFDILISDKAPADTKVPATFFGVADADKEATATELQTALKKAFPRLAVDGLSIEAAKEAFIIDEVVHRLDEVLFDTKEVKEFLSLDFDNSSKDTVNTAVELLKKIASLSSKGGDNFSKLVSAYLDSKKTSHLIGSNDYLKALPFLKALKEAMNEKKEELDKVKAAAETQKREEDRKRKAATATTQLPKEVQDALKNGLHVFFQELDSKEKQKTNPSDQLFKSIVIEPSAQATTAAGTPAEGDAVTVGIQAADGKDTKVKIVEDKKDKSLRLSGENFEVVFTAFSKILQASGLKALPADFNFNELELTTASGTPLSPEKRLEAAKTFDIIFAKAYNGSYKVGSAEASLNTTGASSGARVAFMTGKRPGDASATTPPVDSSAPTAAGPSP